MECPKCGLICPPNSLRCDCGYSFKDKSIKQIENEKKKTNINRFNTQLTGSIIILISGIVFSIILITKIYNSKYDGNLMQKIIEFYLDTNVYVKVKGIPIIILVGVFGVFYNYCKLNTYKKLSNNKNKKTEV